MSKDPYTVLGINKNANEQDIKKAYRQLAREYHPDVNPNNKQAEDKFKEITNAYNFLSDSDVRTKYDRGEIDADGQIKGFSGMGGNRRGGFNPNDFSGFGQKSYRQGKNGAGFDFFSDNADAFGGWGDFFDAFKGGAKGKAPKTDGANVSYNLNVSFIDAVLGANKEISLANGKKIKVKIPEGAEDNMTLRLKNQGMAGSAGGKTGDALITIKIAPHPYFERDKNDIILKLPISLKEAVMGTKITVPTLDGKAMLTIPPNTSNSTLRLRGKGIKALTEQGDLLVKISVVLPSKKDADLEKFVKDWKNADYLKRDF